MKELDIEWIAEVTGGTATGKGTVTGFSIDNREVKPGDLFIAIIGERLDGHRFIESAVENGAAAVMCSRDIDCDVPTVKVPDTVKAFMDMASAYRDTFNIRVVGLTGSVGKTTTKEMTACVLSSEYNTYKTYKNWNNEIGVPKVLLGLGDSVEAAVIEMGMNHKGEISRLSKAVKPDISIITKIGVSHIENLGSREGILSAKLEILDGMDENGILILNGDDRYLRNLKNVKQKQVRFGIESDNLFLKAENIRYMERETLFEAVTGSGRAEVRVPATGVHNVYNALAALTAGLMLDIPLNKGAEALSSYVPAGMREKITEKAGITFMEDCYNASPDSMAALADTIRIMGAGKRKIAVTGDMLELGDHSREAHEAAGKYMADAGVDILLTYGPQSVYTAEAGRKGGIPEVQTFDTHEGLIKKLEEILKEGDLVAFKGSRGMELEKVIEGVYYFLDSEKS